MSTPLATYTASLVVGYDARDTATAVSVASAPVSLVTGPVV
jgi:hypothetical protein